MFSCGKSGRLINNFVIHLIRYLINSHNDIQSRKTIFVLVKIFLSRTQYLWKPTFHFHTTKITLLPSLRCFVWLSPILTFGHLDSKLQNILQDFISYQVPNFPCNILDTSQNNTEHLAHTQTQWYTSSKYK